MTTKPRYSLTELQVYGKGELVFFNQGKLRCIITKLLKNGIEQFVFIKVPSSKNESILKANVTFIA